MLSAASPAGQHPCQGGGPGSPCFPVLACTHVNVTTVAELQAAFAAAWHASRVEKLPTCISPACRESTNQYTGAICGFLFLGPCLILRRRRGRRSRVGNVPR